MDSRSPDTAIHASSENIVVSHTNTFKIIPANPDAPKPEIKRYAHHGKRRRSYTDELFRCKFVSKIVSDNLICGALLWRNKPAELRAHLLTHLQLDIVAQMSDDQVRESYTDAKRIFLEHIPDDTVHGLDEEDLDDDLDIDDENKED